MSNGMLKLQINSREALERLIGGDTPIEIEVRNSIMQEFAKAYLKPLINSQLKAHVDEMIAEAKKELSNAVAVSVKRQDRWGQEVSKLELTDEVKQLIKQERDISVLRHLEGKWSELLDVVDAKLKAYEKSISGHINRTFEATSRKQIEQEIQAKWEELRKKVLE